MFSWLVRLILIPAGIVAGWFVAKDAPNFGVAQLVVALLMMVAVVALLAFWRRNDSSA